jgi:hypothetical protein
MRTAPLLLVFAAGCLRSTQFQCATDADCGGGGVCEAVKFCSFADSSCDGRRFGDSAGPYSNECTSAANMPDAGTGSDSGSGGGSDSGGSVGCPAGYDVVGTLPHKYKVIMMTAAWMNQRDMCAATSSAAYLAIPDDVAELTALDALATDYWIGIDDTLTEGTYLTVKGAPAPTLPWATGEPNNGPPEEDCVSARSATNQIATDRCSDKRRAICECEP